MAEERRSNKIIVKSRDSLTRIDISELHERRFILWFKDEGDAEVSLKHGGHERRFIESTDGHYLGYVLIFFVLLAIVVHKGTPHAEIRYYRRMLFLKEN